jgi:hypothetical protein
MGKQVTLVSGHVSDKAVAWLRAHGAAGSMQTSQPGRWRRGKYQGAGVPIRYSIKK